MRPEDWRARLDFLASRYGKFPDEVALRPWSTLNRWVEWAESRSSQGGANE